MTTENQETDSSMSQDANLKVDNSRRSFARKSVGILPAVMVLANRPAWAETSICGGSGLAFQSFYNAGKADISHHLATADENPIWKTPRYWGSTPNNLPQAYQNDTSKTTLNNGAISAYQLASTINNQVYGNFPPIFLSGGEFYENFDAYQTFYGICASDL